MGCISPGCQDDPPRSRRSAIWDQFRMCIDHPPLKRLTLDPLRSVVSLRLACPPGATRSPRFLPQQALCLMSDIAPRGREAKVSAIGSKAHSVIVEFLLANEICRSVRLPLFRIQLTHPEHSQGGSLPPLGSRPLRPDVSPIKMVCRLTIPI